MGECILQQAKISQKLQETKLKRTKDRIFILLSEREIQILK